MEAEKKASVLVVDDHDLVLEGICKVLNKIPEVSLVDAVTSGKEAVRLIGQREYDLYILDVSIPDVSGFELIASIRQWNPEARIIVNTMHEEIWNINRLVQSKVNAVVLKASASTELVNAVYHVLQGETYVCGRFASISQKLHAGVAFMLSQDKPTRREQEVLEAVAKGMNTHEIAQLLGVSDNTVETFRRRLLLKFGAKNATDMVVKAIAKGWILPQ